MLIRAASALDLTEISRFLSRCWHETYDDIYGVERVSKITAEWHSSDALQDQLQRPGSVFLTAIDRGKIVGVVYASQHGVGEAMLHQLYVNSSLHGSGTAAKLLARVEAGFPDAELIGLEVDELNTRAIAFYKKHGYACVGETENCGQATSGIRALTFAKRLAGGDFSK